MKFPVLWSGLCCYTVKCSEILATKLLLYNPRVNKVFTHSLKFSFICLEMLTNDLTHGFAVDNLAMDDTEEVERPRSGSVPAVQFAEDSDRDSDKEVSEIIFLSINMFFT